MTKKVVVKARVVPGIMVKKGDKISKIMLTDKSKDRNNDSYMEFITGVTSGTIEGLTQRQISIKILGHRNERFLNRLAYVNTKTSEYIVTEGQSIQDICVVLQEFKLKAPLLQYPKGYKFYLDNDYFVAEDNGIYIINNKANQKHFSPCSKK